ncbi:neprilysin-4-like [Anthonomus grandis grandis]|uniref:neprilysin-4-like n=1 Tax=Anthonomus grandis grandis TaxID=2921223 RepID=UPI002165F166|nr:neprilysin-4-like [Anthonomus grandis grandis]
MCCETMKIFVFIFLIVLIGKEDAKTVSSDEEFNEWKYMNLSADPCENFYEYTCGNFEHFYPIADDTIASLMDQFSLLEDKLAAVTNDILKSDIKPNDPEALKKAKSAYLACTETVFMDNFELINPEVRVIQKYRGFPVLGQTEFFGSNSSELSEEHFGWNELADMAAEFGINIFLTPSLYFDTQNASRNILRISTDAMEVPVQFRPHRSPSYEDAIEEGFFKMATTNRRTNGTLRSYGKTLTSMEILLRKLVLKLKRILGSDRSDEYLFERVANISNFLVGVYYGYIPEGTEVSPITNDTTAYVVTLKQLNEWTQKHFGNSVQLDWVEYVKRLLQFTHVDVDENFLVLHPTDLHTSLYGVLNWVRMNDHEIIKSAALLRVFVYTATDSDSESRTYFNDYLKATKKTIYPRWEYCTRKIIDATDTLSLGLAVAYEYQLKYFDTSKLTDALSMVNNLQSTFKEIINETEWMDDDSKAAALTKADNIITLLGYPEFIKNATLLDQFYQNLQITTWDHFENSKQLRAFKNSYTLNMINYRQRKAWEKSPFNANAYMNRQNNRIILPVSMLTSIFFQGSTSSILDYSRLGMIISHEMTHGFDSQGFLYNQFGIIEPWWTEQTIENFKNNSECFVEQYSNYTIPEINVRMNGSGSLNENLADNGGLRIAFRAMKHILDQQNSIKLGSNELTPEQLFFVGYGTMWCSSESVSYLTALAKSCNTTTNCHARSQLRVNGVVSNMEDFANTFNCPLGSPMNPENKCILW